LAILLDSGRVNGFETIFPGDPDTNQKDQSKPDPPKTTFRRHERFLGIVHGSVKASSIPFPFHHGETADLKKAFFFQFETFL
jgi:hypothetical protein